LFIWQVPTDGDGGSGHGSQRHDAPHLDVVGADGVLAAAQALHAIDLEDVAADAGDAGAEGVEEVAQVLDVRFAGGVLDGGVTLGEHGGHDQVLGAGHGRLVHEHHRSLERSGPEPVTVQEAVGGAESLESMHVGIDPAPPDHVTTRWGEVDLAEAGQGRAGQQDRSPDDAGLLLGDFRTGHAVAVDLQGPRLGTGDRRPHALENEEQGLDVTDERHVVQCDRFFGQEAGGDYG